MSLLIIPAINNLPTATSLLSAYFRDTSAFNITSVIFIESTTPPSPLISERSFSANSFSDQSTIKFNLKSSSDNLFPVSSTGKRSPRPTSCILLFSLPLVLSLVIVNTFVLSHPSRNVHFENKNRRNIQLPVSSLNCNNFWPLRKISSTSACIASSPVLPVSSAKYPPCVSGI